MDFTFFGEHFKTAGGAHVVPGAVVGNHWSRAKQYIRLLCDILLIKKIALCGVMFYFQASGEEQNLLFLRCDLKKCEAQKRKIIFQEHIRSTSKINETYKSYVFIIDFY